MEIVYSMLSAGRIIRLLIALLGCVAIWKMWSYMDGNKGPAPKLALINEMEVAATEPLHVAVFYEALCPDSRQFIKDQLKPAVELLNDFISVQLVPYGKATTTEKAGQLTFQCQHGGTECLANKVHGCVTRHVNDQLLQTRIVDCMISNNYKPLLVGEKCVSSIAGADAWPVINDCASSRLGDQILKHMGSLTQDLNPAVSFIPTITVDKNQNGQSSMLKDFTKFLCRSFKGVQPSPCSRHSSP